MLFHLALLPCLALAQHEDAASSTSLDASGLALAIRNGRCAFARNEFSDGVDLNGDGDMQDKVVAIYDPARGTLIGTGLASFSFGGGPWDGDALVMAVDESDQGGTDLNGDGDDFDNVLFAVDLETGASTSLGHAVHLTAPPVALGPLFGYAANESVIYGGGIDLNGDGDLNDYVFFVYDPATGTTSGPRLACPSNLTGTTPYASDAVATGQWVVLLVLELFQGQDLNGDGDMQDSVVHAWHPASGRVLNSGLAADELFASPRLAAFLASEAEGSVDLDGDGDQDDFVVTLFDPVSEAWTVSGVPADPPDPDGGLVVLGETVLFAVPESDTDLNGDGDVEPADTVLHVLAPSGLSNLGVAVDQLLGEGSFGVVRVREERQGQDLNGDGDLADGVLATLDVASGTLRNLGLGTDGLSKPRALSGIHVAITASESVNGVDHNKDGDRLDVVLFVHDLLARTTRNTRLAPVHNPMRPYAWSQGTLLFAVDERAQGMADRNGDGDALDNVVAALRADTGEISNLALAALPSGGAPIYDLEGDVGVATISELHQSDDLNGDGDSLDQVVFELRPGLGAPVAETLGRGTPGAAGFAPRLRGMGMSGGRYVLRVSEGPGGAPGLLVAGTQAALPFLSGTLFVAPITFALPHVLAGTSAGAGSVQLPLELPHTLPVTFQAAYADPSATGGLVLTNGLTLRAGG